MISSIKQKHEEFYNDNRFREIFIGSAWSFGAKVCATFLAMTTNIIIARIYGPEMMGIVAIINSYLLLASIITVQGTDVSILRLIPEHIQKYSRTSAFKMYRKVLTLVVITSLVTGGMLLGASTFTAEKIFAKPQLSFFFSLAAIIVVFKSVVVLNTQVIRSIRLIRIFSFLQLLPALANLILLIIFTLFCIKCSNNPVYALFCALPVSAVVTLLITEYKLKPRIVRGDKIRDTSFAELLRISFPMLLTAVMTFVIGQTGVIILGIFRPVEEVGFYDCAVKLATLTVFILQAVNTMVAPKFSELYQEGKLEDIIYIARKSSKFTFYLTAPLLLLLLIFGKPLLEFLFGAEFTVAYSAMSFLVIGQFIAAISGPTGLFMNMTGEEKKLKNIMIITAMINIILSVLIIPAFGINGAAIAGMLSLAFWNLTTLIYIKLKHGYSIGYIPIVTTSEKL